MFTSVVTTEAIMLTSTLDPEVFMIFDGHTLTVAAIAIALFLGMFRGYVFIEELLSTRRFQQLVSDT